jgi:hypothetical protein
LNENVSDWEKIEDVWRKCGSTRDKILESCLDKKLEFFFEKFSCLKEKKSIHIKLNILTSISLFHLMKLKIRLLLKYIS